MGESKAKLDVACLSYPDMLVTADQISKRYPALADADYRFRSDSQRVAQWHGTPLLKEVIETTSFFENTGCCPEYFDVAEIRGGETVVDLNYPIDSVHQSKFDIVIDTGTLEHCFNVGVAFENMARLVRVGGYIVSAAPISKINHGFWNFSPCAYENYFRQNKFDLLFLGAFKKDRDVMTRIEISANGRGLVPAEATLLAVARRKWESTFKFPTQQKYIK